jgi:hypothetical protein
MGLIMADIFGLVASALIPEPDITERTTGIFRYAEVISAACLSGCLELVIRASKPNPINLHFKLELGKSQYHPGGHFGDEIRLRHGFRCGLRQYNSGPCSNGKTVLASILPFMLTRLTSGKALDVTKIYSVGCRSRCKFAQDTPNRLN